MKPVMFSMKPEFVHEQMTSTGEIMGKARPLKFLMSFLMNSDSSLLYQKIKGIEFKKPIGLAAGFDYDAKLTQILPMLGFGFNSVGTITNMPYGGNPLPMLGRLPRSKSLMVNKGYKNHGAKNIAEKLKRLSFEIPLGISVGRTNSPKLKNVTQSINDIVTAYSIFEEAVVKNSYYELNISCPNLLFAAEDFSDPKNLNMLLKEIEKLHMKKPVFIKMPIEKSDKEVKIMLETIVKFNTIKGVIFGNLQKNRKDPSLDPKEVAKFDRGYFSGKPCEKRSNELIKLAFKGYGKKLTMIGCGGVFSAGDAYKKIKLGASLVQLITGMIYQGPQLISEINLGLVDLLQKDGLKNISEAVGAGY